MVKQVVVEEPNAGEEAIVDIENSIEEVSDIIEETPENRKNREWQEALTSALTEIRTEIASLKKQTGASAEIAALTQQVRELTDKLETQPTIPVQSPKSAEENLSLETPPETSLETAKVEPKQERKNNRSWI